MVLRSLKQLHGELLVLKAANTACTRLVGFGAFSGSLRGLK